MNTLEYYLNDLWKKTIECVKQSEQFPKNEIFMCFDDSKLLSLDNSEALVSVSNFVSFSALTTYHNIIEKALQTIVDDSSIKLVLKDANEIASKEEKSNASNFANRFIKTDFNSKYSFASFVVGRSTIQAKTAAMTVADNPGLIYNPLFIYGNSGVGKTHLLMSIANRIEEISPSKKIAYISGSDFVEGVYQSVKEKKVDEFKSSFKQLDVLLMDDIQFIAGKEKTHEIFFSVFNELVNNKKQICITADRMPSEIKGLEDRIISRFNQGLNVNIEAPEYETAVNILKMKISNTIGNNQTISDEVVSYIANNFASDVRTLEGALTRLLFYSINFAPDKEIGLEVCVAAFQDNSVDTHKELTIDKIKKMVADYYGLTVAQLNSKCRTKNIATARHIAMYLCRNKLDASFKDIGRSFGKRDHSTVINACDTVEEKCKKSSVYAQVVRDLEIKLH